MRPLENGKPVGIPVTVRLSGEDIPTLRAQAEKAKAIFRAIPQADRIRDDWGGESFSANLNVNADRANLANVSNLDVAASSSAGLNAVRVTTLREGRAANPRRRAPAGGRTRAVWARLRKLGSGYKMS